jgi:diguanylate cyclase (GGDEF)-like protein
MSSWRQLAQCRLCRRVTIAIFVAVLLIEAVAVAIAARKYESDRVADVEQRGLAAVTALFATHPYPMDGKLLLSVAGPLATHTAVVGGSFYRNDGAAVGSFGEPPALAGPEAFGRARVTRLASADGARTDVVWYSDQIGAPFVLVARLDTASVREQVRGFAIRIAVLVLAVSIAVTAAAAVVLGRTLLAPILGLRARLLDAPSADGAAADAAAADPPRDDELGDVVSVADGMRRRLAAGIAEMREQQSALEQAKLSLERQMAERTRELMAVNDSLRQEIAERRRAESEAARLARLPDEDPNPVLRIAADATLLYANAPARPLLDLFKISVGEKLPQPWLRIVEGVSSGEAAPAEIEVQCGPRVFELVFQPVPAEGYVNAYGRDVSERKRAEREAQALVNRDPVAGLPNRTLFQDRLQTALNQAKRSKRRVAVHVLDLDHFKDVNDTMGHAAGDEVLRAMGQRLKRCVRESDTVARLGGDEFAVIQPDVTEADGIDVLAQKILAAVAEPLRVGDQTLHMAASIGVTVLPEDATDAEQVLRNAELALYQAKGEGRGIHRFFVARMNEESQRRRAIEADLRQALDRGDFLLHYQPKLNLGTNRIPGAEALIRWRHPEQGFLAPGVFVPIAEKCKLIVPIGNWALQQACRQTKAWQDAGLPPLKVAVNLSAVQLREKGLVAAVRRALDDANLDARHLELEITESVAMDDAESTIRLFRELAGIGVSLSIDDFGTGYSSLSYLKNFPVQRIKIDKAFIDGIGIDPKLGAIARAVTMIGHGFDMEVTAEGVETVEQVSFLSSLQCDEIQGYVLAKPMPSTDFQVFVDSFHEGVSPLRQAAKRGHARSR